MAQKKERFITPALLAVWPKLDVVDVYKPESGPEQRRYVTDAAEVNAGDLEKVKAYLLKKFKEAYPDYENEPNMPFKEETQKDKKTGKKSKTGRILITAKSGEKFKPPMFDAKNKRIADDVAIGGGTKFKLDLTIFPYKMTSKNAGITLYINAVQVLDLVEKGIGKSNFEEADGFEYEGDGKPQSSFGATDDKGEDPLAF
jgi:hypothetical protein